MCSPEYPTLGGLSPHGQLSSAADVRYEDRLPLTYKKSKVILIKDFLTSPLTFDNKLIFYFHNEQRH